MSLHEVERALQPLSYDETRLLVFHLGVEEHVLQDIDGDPLRGSRSIKAIKAWLDRDLKASWEKLVSCLLPIKNVLANQLATQHCPQLAVAVSPSSGPEQPATVQSVHTPATPLASAAPSPPATGPVSGSEQSPDPPAHTTSSPPPIPPDQPPLCSHQPPTPTFWSLEKVKATIQELEVRFLDLNTDVEDEICEKEEQDKKFLRKFRKYLQLMPVSRRAPHSKFFRECEREIQLAEDVQGLIGILCRYVNYRNYEPLREIVVMFCGSLLQASMQDYCVMLEMFEKATPVNTYTNAISAGKRLKIAFSRMVLRINKSEFECTLYEIRKLKEEIAEAASLSSHSVYIEGEGVHCVEVAISFPSSVVGWILSAMTPDFMTTHHITEVAVDDRKLTVVQAERHQLVGSVVYRMSILCKMDRSVPLYSFGHSIELSPFNVHCKSLYGTVCKKEFWKQICSVCICMSK